MEVNVAKLKELEKQIEQCRDEAEAINEVSWFAAVLLQWDLHFQLTDVYTFMKKNVTNFLSF